MNTRLLYQLTIASLAALTTGQQRMIHVHSLTTRTLAMRGPRVDREYSKIQAPSDFHSLTARRLARHPIVDHLSTTS